MCSTRGIGTVVAVDGYRQHSRIPAGSTPGLFLVEFFGGVPARRAEDMHAALQHAVSRLHAAGTDIRWCAGWLVPAGQRCLCLVEAVDEAAVVLARDTAALTAASVQLVRPLPRRTRSPRSPLPRERS